MAKTYTFEGAQPVRVAWEQNIDNDDGTLTPHPEFAGRHSIELMLAEGDELPPISLADRFTLSITIEEER